MTLPNHVTAYHAGGPQCELRRYEATELIHHDDERDPSMGQTKQQKAGAELHRLTTAYMETHKTGDYRLALIEVARENPELVTTYSRPAEDDLKRVQHEAGNEIDRRARVYTDDR